MAHKVHPKIFRIRRIDDWQSRGFYKSPIEFMEDFKIREVLAKLIGKTGIEKIEIERFARRLNVIIYSARPGLIIRRGGEGIEILRKEVEKAINRKNLAFIEFKDTPLVVEDEIKQDRASKARKKSSERREIKIEIREVKNPWTCASLIGQWVAMQLEKRIPFRKALKQALGKVKANREIQGARIEVSGRLNGNEIARREWLKDGRLPLQTLRADIDYAKAQAHCTYGVIGIKVWLYKGDKFD